MIRIGCVIVNIWPVVMTQIAVELLNGRNGDRGNATGTNTVVEKSSASVSMIRGW